MSCTKGAAPAALRTTLLPSSFNSIRNVMAEALVIYGSGQMAEVAFARLRCDDRYEIVGFVVDRAHLPGDSLCGLPIVPFEDVEQHFPAASVRLFISVGPVQCNRVRADRFVQAKQRGYRFISYVSAHAIRIETMAIFSALGAKMGKRAEALRTGGFGYGEPIQ